MEEITTIGLDIAKSVFQVHGIDALGKVVVQRRLTRGRLLPFLPSCHRDWWVSKLAAPLIIGRGSWSRSAMMFG